MPGRSSDSTVVQYIGAFVALVAIIGYLAFDWQFGSADGIVPYVVGLGCVIVAIGWTIYQRL